VDRFLFVVFRTCATTGFVNETVDDWEFEQISPDNDFSVTIFSPSIS